MRGTRWPALVDGSPWFNEADVRFRVGRAFCRDRVVEEDGDDDDEDDEEEDEDFFSLQKMHLLVPHFGPLFT